MAEQNKPKQQGPFRPDFRKRSSFFFILPLLFLIPWIFGQFTGPSPAAVPYSFFISQLDGGNVQSIVVQGENISGTFKTPIEYRDERSGASRITEFITYVPLSVEGSYLDRLSQANVEVITRPTKDNSGWLMLFNFLPLILLIFLFVRFSKASGQQGGGFGAGGMFSMGANKAKRYEKSTDSVTFADVAGAESSKEELMEIVDFLRHPDRYAAVGALIPHGILLVGPPGSGKTLLAKAVAGEADVPFYSISGSDFIEMFVGVGASRVRNLFKEAREHSPSIIFIDELDSIGRHRGAGLGGGHDEREQTLNQMLAEMDGFEKQESVIVLAATNRPDVLDPALLRPGRFDRKVTVPAPAVGDREKILEVHIKTRPAGDDVDLDVIARTTPGFSGADLANLINEASIQVVRDNRAAIRQDDLLIARDRILLGLKRSGMVVSDEELKTVAYHEAGHAVTAARLPTTEPVHRISIIPHEQAMGVTQQMPEGDMYLLREDYLRERLVVLMAGRAAEEQTFGVVTSGAENDLKQAHKLARRMVSEWGMGTTFRNTAFASDAREVFLGSDIGRQNDYSDDSARRIDEDIHNILVDAYDRAKKLLKENATALKDLAEALLVEEEINRERMEEIIGVI
ncbi:MAG: ATP-dependent zinc metalloprotease FtsH [Alkalispirochaeta sp.]